MHKNDGQDLPVEPQRRALMKSLGAVGLWAASPSSAPATPTPIDTTHGPAVRIEAGRLNQLAAEFFPVFNHGNVLPDFDATAHGARYSVELRRLTTYTLVPETGERVKVSGLLAIPAGVRGPLPVVSWQHGTILSFDQVPSNLTRLGDPGYQPSDAGDSLETLFNLQRLAGQGFAVIAADYLGKGPFRDGRVEAYAVREATVTTCLDMLQAGTSALHQLGHTRSHLFLNGWSQGGLNTQWLAQALKDRKIPVSAAAAQSPFNNLVDSVRYWTGQLPVPDAATYPAVANWAVLCLIVVLGSYRSYYRLPDLFKTAIKPQYHEFAEAYWQSYQLTAADLAKAPGSVGDLLVEGLLERYTGPTNSAFIAQLGRNISTYQSYDFPFRFYYGLADEALHPSMMGLALASAGSKATGIAVPRASHRATFLASLYGSDSQTAGMDNVLNWFTRIKDRA